MDHAAGGAPPQKMERKKEAEIGNFVVQSF